MSRPQSKTHKEAIDLMYAKMAKAAAKEAVAQVEFRNYMSADAAASWTIVWANKSSAKAVRWQML